MSQIPLSFIRWGFANQLPMIHQTEAAECSLACIAMIASYHGYATDIASIRRKIPLSLKGATLAGVMKFARSLGLLGRPVRIELNALSKLQTPCLLHWDLNHFVVLKKATTKWILVHDPAVGVRKIGFHEATNHFTGVAVELSPSTEFRKADETERLHLADLFRQVTGMRGAILKVVALSLSLEAIAVISPFFQQWVVDGILVENDRDLLRAISVGFFLMMLLQTSISTFRSWLITHFSIKLNLQWTSNLFAKLFDLPVSYFEQRQLGDIVSRFGAMSSIREVLTNAALSSALDGMMALAALVMMCIYSVSLAAISVSALAIYICVRYAFYEPFKHANRERILLSAKAQSHFLESVRGHQAIKLCNRENDRRIQWLNLLVNTTNRDLATQRMSIVFKSINTLAFGAENILVTYLGALSIMQGNLSLGMLFAYIAYKNQFGSRIGGLVDLYFDLKMLRIQGERLADIALADSEANLESSTYGERSISSIDLKNVRFRYGINEPWILDGINLSIKDGESVAVVGPSGCGKTTLMKIMLGLLQPTEGDVVVGGVPLKSVGLRAYRDVIAAVMQEDQLFAGTILDNITFNSEATNADRAEICSVTAGIHDEIAAMPMAYQTFLGDMGIALSGGQKQRVLLARALYRNPKLLFLDEATSHLDPEKELQVMRNIKALNLTRISIAHRQETVAAAARVIRLESGRIADDRVQDEMALIGSFTQVDRQKGVAGM